MEDRGEVSLNAQLAGEDRKHLQCKDMDLGHTSSVPGGMKKRARAKADE